MTIATIPPDEPAQAPPPEDDWPEPAELAEADLDTVDLDTAEPGAALPRASAAATATEDQMAAWIAAIAQQDERALVALYDASFSRVYGLVRRIVHNAALAEEVVEDAYFQVWRQALRFDRARGKPLTWLLAVARSRAIDALRREARFSHDPLVDDAPGEPGELPPQDELLDLARHRADLHQALMLLGAQPRQLVSMSFFRGLSHEEIAEQMDLPLGTVKSQIRRALLALRASLGDAGTRLLAS